MSLKIVKSFSLDFTKTAPLEYIFVKTGDRNSRILDITPLNSGKPYNIPDGAKALFIAKKPDGTDVVDNAEIDSESGHIFITLSDQTLAAEGVISCEIGLYGAEGEYLSSQHFYMKADERLLDGVASSNEYEAMIVAMLAADQKVREIETLKEDNASLHSQIDNLLVKVYEQQGAAALEVEKITSNVYAVSTTYSNEQFILLDIYPKTNGTVNVTYGSLTKTITDTSGAAEPSAQKVFFGTFSGVSDSVTTPDNGILTITGDYRGFGVASYNSAKSTVVRCSCITKIITFGNAEYIPDYAFYGCAKITSATTTVNITSIGNYAFENCSSLVEVVIGANLTLIGKYAFSNCSSLESAVFVYSKEWYAKNNLDDTIMDGAILIAVQIMTPYNLAKALTITHVARYWERT